MSHHEPSAPALCANCDAALQPAFKFCPVCGQKSALHRLSMHDVLHDALHYFTHADKGILTLIRALALKTGTVAREYVAGKRKKYFPPLNFFLLMAALYVLGHSFYAHHAPEVKSDWRASVEKIPDPVVRHAVTRIYERRDFVTGLSQKYSNVIYMIATPFLTLIIWLFYSRGRYNYTEHLIASLYLTGFCALVNVVFFAPLELVPALQQYRVPLVGFFVFEICYRAFFYNRFINNPRPGARLKNWLVAFFVVLFWASFSFSVFYFYIRDGFWGLMP